MPDDPVLAATAEALNDAGHWAEIFDPTWRCAYLTDDARVIYGGRVEPASWPVGAHVFSPEAVDAREAWGAGQFPLPIQRQMLVHTGPVILFDTPGGMRELRDLVDPRLVDILDGLTPLEPPAALSSDFLGLYTAAGAEAAIRLTMLRLRAPTGELAGTVLLAKPAAGMAVLSRMTGMGDLGHMERIEHVVKPGLRPAAILFADLESSSDLARRLSTAADFALVRRMARAADQCVVDTGGLVGTHAGDGLVAFFLAETAGSESAAARSSIEAARGIKAAMAAVAERSDLPPEALTVRFGLHWSAALYMGQIATAARTEVTALGDGVNAAARIEPCARGGRVLASKDLIERLDPEDAAALDLDPDHITYTPLGDLGTATEKARRDAPTIAVCDV